MDDQGRVLRTTQLGFRLERQPYEVAFENWRTDSTHLTVTDDRDVLETTAIASNKRLDHRVDALVVRLRNVDLGFQRGSVLLMNVDSSRPGADGNPGPAAYKELLARLGAIPGVRSATFSAVT